MVFLHRSSLYLPVIVCHVYRKMNMFQLRRPFRMHLCGFLFVHEHWRLCSASIRELLFTNFVFLVREFHFGHLTAHSNHKICNNNPAEWNACHDMVWQLAHMVARPCSTPGIDFSIFFFGNRSINSCIQPRPQWIEISPIVKMSVVHLWRGVFYFGSIEMYFYCFEMIVETLKWRTEWIRCRIHSTTTSSSPNDETMKMMRNWKRRSSILWIACKKYHSRTSSEGSMLMPSFSSRSLSLYAIRWLP